MAVPAPKEEILAILKGITTTGESLDLDDASKASETRRALLTKAKKLVAALEDPHAEVWPRAFQVNVGVSVSRCLLHVSHQEMFDSQFYIILYFSC